MLSEKQSKTLGVGLLILALGFFSLADAVWTDVLTYVGCGILFVFFGIYFISFFHKL